MNLPRLRQFAAAVLLLAAPLVTRAQDAAPAPAPAAAPDAPAAEPKTTRDIVTLINQQLQAGKRTPEELAPELKAFDKLITDLKKSDPDEAGQAMMMKAMLYAQVFEDMDTTKTILNQVKTDFAGTKFADDADGVLAQIDEQAKAEKAKDEVIGKQAPEIHFSWSTQDGLKSLSDLKGKVVVVDFWATWCGPCVHSFPEIAKLVEHYKGAPVVVVGVTSPQGRIIGLEDQPIDCEGDLAKEQKLMGDYVKKMDMTWTVAMSTEEVFNPDYHVDGIPHITIIAPDGTVRANGIHPSLPLEKKAEKIDAILNEFKLPLPAPTQS